MTNDLAMVLLRLNLVFSAAILGILLLRTPVRRLCGSDIAYRLWILLPLATLGDLLVSILSLKYSFRGLPAIPQAIVPDLPANAPWIWLAGAMLGFGYFAIAHLHGLARLKRGQAGPAVTGLLNPRICLPADFAERFTPPEQRLIREHERVHLARNDLLTNAAMALMQCLFWYNPLVHVATLAIRLDQEMACDAQVLEDHPDQRRRYAETMFKAQIGAGVGCAFARHPLESRLAAIARGEPSVYLRVPSMVALSFGVVAMIGFYANALGGGDLAPLNTLLMQIRPS